MITIQVQTGPRTDPLTYLAPDDVSPGDVVLIPVLATVIAIGSEAGDDTPQIIRVAGPAEVAAHHG